MSLYATDRDAQAALPRLSDLSVRWVGRLAIALDAVATSNERCGAARGFWRRQGESVQGNLR
jgi:hypothetical protein